MWAVTTSKFYFSEGKAYFLGIKPFFHGLLWLNYQLSLLFGVYPMDLGRFVWGFLALSVMLLLNEILKAKRFLFADRFLFQMLLFGTSFWMYRATEIRSDLVGTFLFCVAFYVFVMRDRSTKFQIFGIATCVLVGLLFTAKSILVFFPILFIGRFHFNVVKKIWPLLFLSFVLFGVIFQQTLIESFTFFIHQIHSSSSIEYFSILRWRHVLRLVRENPQVIILILALLSHLLLNQFWNKDFSNRKYFYGAIYYFLILWLYPDPLPFFISAYLPLFYLFSFLAMRDWIWQTPYLVKMAISVILFFNCLNLFVKASKHSNEIQRTVTNWALQEFRGRSDIVIYDPTGFYAPKNGEHWFIGPSMSNEYYENILQLVSDQMPEVIFYTQKLIFLEPKITALLRERYFRWAPSVYLLTRQVKDLSFKSCAELQKDLNEKLFKGRFSEQNEFSFFVQLEGEDFGYGSVNQFSEICKLIQKDEIQKLYVFATKPPSRPVENFVELFRYDPYF
tara:strand:+ start:441 stop:1955 length:1515 start_codon:yes stop_codon:yes gene_type:complete